MSDMLFYSEKSRTYFNLYNPAFCAQLLRIVLDEYEDKSKKQMPFSISFLILPILLNKELRVSVTHNANFHTWVVENYDKLTHFNESIRNLIDITKSALIFLLQTNTIKITKNADIELVDKKYTKTFSSSDQELLHYYKQSLYLGRLLSYTNDSLTTFSILGIKP